MTDPTTTWQVRHEVVTETVDPESGKRYRRREAVPTGGGVVRLPDPAAADAAVTATDDRLAALLAGLRARGDGELADAVDDAIIDRDVARDTRWATRLVYLATGQLALEEMWALVVREPGTAE